MNQNCQEVQKQLVFYTETLHKADSNFFGHEVLPGWRTGSRRPQSSPVEFRIPYTDEHARGSATSKVSE